MMINNHKYQPYKLIVADPPWSYRNKRTGGSMMSGSESKYQTMELKDIIDLRVKQIANKDSVLFLWSTTPFLQDAFKVMDAWGFKYKTAIYWRKIMSLGMGFWFRGQVEVCLMGVRGKIKAFRIQKPNVIQSKVRQHSQKPEEFFELIKNIDLQPKIELFACQKREGWDSLGYGVGDKDISFELDKIVVGCKPNKIKLASVKNRKSI